MEKGWLVADPSSLVISEPCGRGHGPGRGLEALPDLLQSRPSGNPLPETLGSSEEHDPPRRPRTCQLRRGRRFWRRHNRWPGPRREGTVGHVQAAAAPWSFCHGSNRGEHEGPSRAVCSEPVPPECQRPGGDVFSKSSAWWSVWGPSHCEVNRQDSRAVEPLRQERHRALAEVSHGAQSRSEAGPAGGSSCWAPAGPEEVDPRDSNVSLSGPESWLHTWASSESLPELCVCLLLLLLLCPISREKSQLLRRM